MLKGIFGSHGAFKSLTFWGVVGVLSGTVVGHFEPSLLPANVDAGLQVAGTVAAVLGLRRSSNKTVAEIAKLVEGLNAQRRG